MARRHGFSRSFGPYGCRVRLYERPGGVLWIEVRIKGQPRAESLGHRDRALGIEQATRRQAELALGLGQVGKAPTVGALLTAFRDRQAERVGDGAGRRGLTVAGFNVVKRAVAYWLAVLGPEREAASVTVDDVERASERRASGAVSARGEAVPPGRRRPVGARAVGADLEVLRAAFRWAVGKRRLLPTNPLEGLTIAEELNPRRPVASADRFDATRAVAERVGMELRGDGHRVTVTSYLPELLDLAYSTGRRLSAICALRYEDLRLDTPPFGAVRWPADTDKAGKEWTAPLDSRARAALDRVLVDREVGTRARWPRSAWLFPSPRNADRPVSKDLASAWLERAEALAGLPKLTGSLWHAYRRGWATSRKHHPLADVAAAGGWKTRETLARIYQQPDADATLRAVLEPRELRSSG